MANKVIEMSGMAGRDVSQEDKLEEYLARASDKDIERLKAEVEAEWDGGLGAAPMERETPLYLRMEAYYIDRGADLSILFIEEASDSDSVVGEGAMSPSVSEWGVQESILRMIEMLIS